MDHFPCNVTHTCKFDYYSMDHTWEGSTCFKCLTFCGENPTSTRTPATLLWCGTSKFRLKCKSLLCHLQKCF